MEGSDLYAKEEELDHKRYEYLKSINSIFSVIGNAISDVFTIIDDNKDDIISFIRNNERYFKCRVEHGPANHNIFKLYSNLKLITNYPDSLRVILNEIQNTELTRHHIYLKRLGV